MTSLSRSNSLESNDDGSNNNNNNNITNLEDLLNNNTINDDDLPVDDIYEGKLISANEKNINLVWKVKEPKPVGKGKITVEKSIDINYSKIKEAKVKVKF